MCKGLEKTKLYDDTTTSTSVGIFSSDMWVRVRDVQAKYSNCVYVFCIWLVWLWTTLNGGRSLHSPTPPFVVAEISSITLCLCCFLLTRSNIGLWLKIKTWNHLPFHHTHIPIHTFNSGLRRRCFSLYQQPSNICEIARLYAGSERYGGQMSTIVELYNGGAADGGNRKVLRCAPHRFIVLIDRLGKSIRRSLTKYRAKTHGSHKCL